MDHRIQIRRRNGVEFAFCTACQGEGCHDYYDLAAAVSHVVEPCKVCDTKGEWRVTPPDLLEQVAWLRQNRHLGLSYVVKYGEVLQLAVSPSCLLPADRAPVAMRRAA